LSARITYFSRANVATPTPHRVLLANDHDVGHGSRHQDYSWFTRANVTYAARVSAGCRRCRIKSDIGGRAPFAR